MAVKADGDVHLLAILRASEPFFLTELRRIVFVAAVDGVIPAAVTAF